MSTLMAGSQNYYSDRDEDFTDLFQQETDLMKLQCYKIYVNNSSFQLNGQDIFCDHFRDSLFIVNGTINQLLKLVDEECYNRYIERKKSQHAIKKTLNYTEKFLQECIIDHDHDTILTLIDIEDNESEPPVIDTWVRKRINVDTVKNITEQQEDSGQEQAEPEEQKASRSHAIRYKQRSQTRKVQTAPKDPTQNESELKKFEPKPLDQEKEKDLELEELIEKHRQHKIYEQKRKDEKEEKERQIQQKTTEVKKDLKNQKMIYDFDGRLLQAKVINPDKLPPANFLVPFHCKDQEDQEKKQKQKKKEKEGPQAAAGAGGNTTTTAQQQKPKTQETVKIGKTQPGTQKQTQQQQQLAELEDKQNQKQINSKGAFSFNEFKPSTGVTLYFDSKIKEGPNLTQSIVSLDDLENKLRLIAKNEPLRITRSEYKRLTEKGNLNMTQTYKKPKQLQQLQNEKQYQFTQSLDSKNISSILDNSGMQKDASSMSSSNLNKKLFGTTHKSQPGLPTQVSPTLDSKIKISSSKLTDVMLHTEDIAEEDEDEFNNKTGNSPRNKKKGKLPRIDSFQEKIQRIKTPVDDFNSQILKSTEWGKSKGGGAGSAVVVNQGNIPKNRTKLKQLQSTLNQFYKLPRERDIGQNNKLIKDVQITNNKLVDDLGLNMRGTFYTVKSKFNDTLRSSNNQ